MAARKQNRIKWLVFNMAVVSGRTL